MPKYDYQCLDCQEQFELRHSYKFTEAQCSSCKSCKVTKVLSSVSNILKKGNSRKGTQKAGEEVEKAIEDGKKELLASKKDIQGKVYKK